MTRPDRDYDDILSRVLHSTLDPIEPLGDGLAKIQQRIAEPWLRRQVWLLRTETSALGWLILVRCEPFVNWAKSVVGGWLRPGRHGGYTTLFRSQRRDAEVRFRAAWQSARPRPRAVHGRAGVAWAHHGLASSRPGGGRSGSHRRGRSLHGYTDPAGHQPSGEYLQ